MAVLKYTVVFFVFTWGALSSRGQTAEYLSYDWEESPQYNTPEYDEDDSEITISRKQSIEFVWEDEGFYQYEFVHDIVYLVDDAAIERNNKIYLTTESGSKVFIQKVRVLNEDGQIVVFDENDIKEGVDEESGVTYEYFAIEGLERGSIIEWLYLVREVADYNGTILKMGSTHDRYNFEFEVISGDHLVFEFKTINGLGEMVLDTTVDNKNVWRVTMDKIPAFEDEIRCNPASLVPTVIYKLEENKYKNKRNITSYDATVQGIYQYIYSFLSKADNKAMASLVKNSGVNSKMDDEEKVAVFENYLKHNYAVLTYVPDEIDNIAGLIEHKAGTNNTFLKLYANVLKTMDIEHEIVLTCDRTDYLFDRDFEAICFLDEGILYLPGLDLYLAPQSSDLRLGYVPWGFTNNYGLFIKSLKIGDMMTGIGEVQFIEPLGSDKNQYNHYITVDMTGDIMEPRIEFEVELKGYDAAFLQTDYAFLSSTEVDLMKDNFKEVIVPGRRDFDLEISNTDPLMFGEEPVRLTAVMESDHFMGKAGNKIILKVGDLIGPQSEMYSEGTRHHPVDSDFMRSFDRTIKIKLPDDYEISNQESLKMEVGMPDGSAIFRSDYTITDEELVIEVDESYDKVIYTAEEFEDYKNVINSAADFNKLVLYFTMK